MNVELLQMICKNGLVKDCIIVSGELWIVEWEAGSRVAFKKLPAINAGQPIQGLAFTRQKAISQIKSRQVGKTTTNMDMPAKAIAATASRFNSFLLTAIIPITNAAIPGTMK